MEVRRPYDGITLENFADWVESSWTRRSAHELAIMTLGLIGESAEVSEHIKKSLRGDGPVDRNLLRLELGDVLHYLCRIAREFDIDIESIMVANIEKLEARRAVHSSKP